MTIRLKILIGCLALTLLTGLVGMLANRAEHTLARLTLQVYDDAFMGMSYLRSAQVGFADVSAAAHDGGRDAWTVTSILEDLNVAHERAMSPTGRKAIELLREHVNAAWLRNQSNPAALAPLPIKAEFEKAVETFAGDGFGIRRNTATALKIELHRNQAALSASLAAALAITLLLSRLIVPPVRRAVLVAQEIAAGRLDNVISVTGRGETADLLRALSTMQSSIARAMARIHALMEEQASSHAGEIAVHHGRMAAALDNMAQGLCLFDSNNRLTVVNKRFAEMFGGAMPVGATSSSVANRLGFQSSLDAAPDAVGLSFSYDTPDGRTIAVSRQPVVDGGWVFTYSDVSEQRAFERRLVYMAQHDVLTGLPNRAFYSDYIQQAKERMSAGMSLAVLCLDLDRFKIVNDTLGHHAGDILLRAVAQRILDTCRKEDLVVRLGGDEFVVVQESRVPSDEAASLSARLVAALSAPFMLDQQVIVIGTSIGIAMADTAHVTAELLLKRADIALYKAKSEGRGTVRLFEEEMDITIQLRRRLELDLRAAVVGEQFEVYYQPLLKVSGGIGGFEALVRWNHPVRGQISPEMFISIAEEIGLIASIGRWVLRQACRDAATWPADVKVAVNFSPLQFIGTGLVDEIQDALTSSGLAPARLEVEITESVLLGDDSTVLQTLHAIRNLGVRVSMDDFGTGYSSLSYLRRFPFDKIKIDRSFVNGMSGQKDCLAIVRAVIGLGRSLGMDVNAEGVETEQQRETLEDEGCNELQGYLISRPVALNHVHALLREHGVAVRGTRKLEEIILLSS
jgi:diguanylate cyclase (GGDEF)-like protein